MEKISVAEVKKNFSELLSAAAYGNEEYNDVWPYATCLGSGVTNKRGNLLMWGYGFDYKEFVSDDVAQKLWIVPSSDVDCDLGKMIAWNPSEYLFETNTL